MLRQNPQRIGQLLQQRVRLIVGAKDEFYLNEAIAFLKVTLEVMHIPTAADQRFGYIRIIPGVGHGTILHTPEALHFPIEALQHLARNFSWIGQ